MLSSAVSPSPLEVLATKFHLGGIPGLIVAFVIILFIPVSLLLCVASRSIYGCLRSRRRPATDIEAQVDHDTKIHALCTFTGTICREGCTCKYAGLPFPASPSFQSFSAAYTPALPTLTYKPLSVPTATLDEKHAIFKKQFSPRPVHRGITRTMSEDIEVASGPPPVLPRSKSKHYPPRVPSPLSTMPVHTADEQDMVDTPLDASLVPSDPTDPDQTIHTSQLMPAAAGTVTCETPRPARAVVTRFLPPIPAKPTRPGRVFGDISLRHINGSIAPTCKLILSHKQIPPLNIRKTRPPIKRHRGTHPISAPFF
ncbi:hypothetical protein BD410DRAFT_893091 [Rickenella mellea]|uniref:Uncharacterized protein n=1 Tax=Rickenella mellea TaxID=50990 RepID=A0A4R5XHF9_9AGAM|nr:hypothetical protein BD410DRAFT_893091 [Rickenella mellea]